MLAEIVESVILLVKLLTAKHHRERTQGAALMYVVSETIYCQWRRSISRNVLKVLSSGCAHDSCLLA